MSLWILAVFEMTTTKMTDVCTIAQMSEQGVYPSDEQRHSFAKRLLTWFELHGRHGLPWQYHHQPSADIYAVWVSEIMLQQTQVVTVLKFLSRFWHDLQPYKSLL